MTIERYVSDLPLADWQPPPGTRGRRHRRGEEAAPAIPEDLAAAVNAGSLLSFVEGVDGQERDDVLFSVQFAQRAASAKFDRFDATRDWYGKYIEVLERIGWAGEQFAFTAKNQEQGEFRMDKSALAVIAAIATQNQIAVLTQSIEALESLADEDGALRLFDFQTANELGGNFQIGAVQKAPNGLLSMALGAFYFRAAERRRRFLFFKWGEKQVNMFTAAQKMTFNATLYAASREPIRARLGAEALSFIEAIELA